MRPIGSITMCRHVIKMHKTHRGDVVQELRKFASPKAYHLLEKESSKYDLGTMERYKVECGMRLIREIQNMFKYRLAEHVTRRELMNRIYASMRKIDNIKADCKRIYRAEGKHKLANINYGTGTAMWMGMDDYDFYDHDICLEECRRTEKVFNALKIAFKRKYHINHEDAREYTIDYI